MLPTHSSVSARQLLSRRGHAARRRAWWGSIWIVGTFPACSQPSEHRTSAAIAPFIALEEPLTTRHTCAGAGHSPALTWSPGELPNGTTHLAWVMTSSRGVVWSAWDAPVETGGVPTQFPPAHSPPLQGTNYLRRIGWAPPCTDPQTATVAPSEINFEMFALEQAASIPPIESPGRLIARLRGAALARATASLVVPESP